jgi:hypothetical protein
MHEPSGVPTLIAYLFPNRTQTACATRDDRFISRDIRYELSNPHFAAKGHFSVAD